MAALRRGCVIGFWIQTELVSIKYCGSAVATLYAVMAVTTEVKLPIAANFAIAFVHQEDRFLAERTRLLKLIERRANFSNPCARRIALRSARGFATFMRRLRTRRPEPSFA